jgi:diacylglycerol kinase
MKPSNSFTLSILAMLLILVSGYLKLGVEAVNTAILTIN